MSIPKIGIRRASPKKQSCIRIRRASGGRAGCETLLDIGGSLAALVLASPLYFAIGVAIKLTSKGPVLFRQQRVGQYAGSFHF